MKQQDNLNNHDLNILEGAHLLMGLCEQIIDIEYQDEEEKPVELLQWYLARCRLDLDMLKSQGTKDASLVSIRVDRMKEIKATIDKLERLLDEGESVIQLLN